MESRIVELRDNNDGCPSDMVDADGWRLYSNVFPLLQSPIIGVYHHRIPMYIQPTDVLTLCALQEEEIHCIADSIKRRRDKLRFRCRCHMKDEDTAPIGHR